MGAGNKKTPAKAIEIAHLDKWFGSFQALKDINMDVNNGERIVICGPSGSGKSTLIRCINGLEGHEKGRIIVDGVEVNENMRNVEHVRRDVGMVFQQFNLFPHLTILENCTLAPVWVRKMKEDQAKKLARDLLARVRIADQADKYPGELSGGQRRCSFWVCQL